jgi:teichoic acid transport system permease protein
LKHQDSTLKRNIYTVWSLAISDFKKRHAGSALGLTWIFIQPLVTIGVFWFVFAMGMRTETVQGVPFLIWLICGLVPWFYFSEALAGAANSLVEHSYLVKKIVFTVGLLPVVKITSALLIHLIFLGLLSAVAWGSGLTPSYSNLQVIYYSLATTALVSSVGFITTSVVPFFRDLSQIVAIVLQFGMWLTPIMWDSSRLPENLRWVLFLNPVTYLVEGYRDTFLRQTYFWDKPLQGLYFWVFVVVCGIFGRVLFVRLKPHFADVL